MRRLFLGLAICSVLVLRGNAQDMEITVCASGCDFTNSQLQSALNSSTCGADVLIQQDFDYVGTFVLPARADACATYSEFYTGVSSTGTLLSAGLFPASDNVRATHAVHSSVFANLRGNTTNEGALRTVEPGEVGARCSATPCRANYWRVKWIEFQGNQTNWSGAMLTLGSSTTSASTMANGDTQNLRSEIPHHIDVLQNLFTGDPFRGHHRAMAIHANNVVIRGNSTQNIKSISETQSIWINNLEVAPTIINNRLSGGAETILAGGAQPAIAQVGTVETATTTTVTLDTVTDLEVGQGLGCTAGSVIHLTFATDVTGQVVTVSPAFPTAPAVGATCNWNVVHEDLTVQKNHLFNDLAWRNPIIDTPTGVSTTAFTTGGTLASGSNYCYRVVSRANVSGGVARSTAAAEDCSTVTSGTTGSVRVNWLAVPNAETYYVYGRTTAGQNIRWSVTEAVACGGTANCSWTDTGASGTSEAVPTSTGTKFMVKNLFELKHMDGALVEGNVFENVWAGGGQTGYGILFTPACQPNSSGCANSGRSTIVRDIIFRHNHVIGGAGFMQITGRDASSTGEGQQAGPITVYNNLVEGLDSTVYYGFANRTIIISSPGRSGTSPRNGPKDVTINHNTIIHHNGNHFLLLDLGRNGVNYPVENLTFTNNLLRANSSGFGYLHATLGNLGMPSGYTYAIAGYEAGSSWLNNAIAGIGTCGNYPATTLCPTVTAFEQDHFVDYNGGAGGDYNLVAGSAYNNAATDGTDIGADIAAIEAFTDIARSGDDTGGAPPPTVTITTTSLPNGTVGAAYSQTLALSGGTSTFTWSVASGSLPAGLSMSAGGAITGTPTTVGTSQFTARVVDSASPAQSDTQALSITIDAASATLEITTTSFAGDTVQVPIPYSKQLVKSGGTDPVVWSISSGTLPPGCALSTSGLFTCVPTTAGTYNFTAQVTDSAGSPATDTQALSLDVEAEAVPSGCSRPVGGVNRTPIVTFRSGVAPTACVMVGDKWINTSTSPPTTYVAILPSPIATWTAEPAAAEHAIISHNDYTGTAPAVGGLIVGGESGQFVLLPLGEDGELLTSSGGQINWAPLGNLDASALTSGIIDPDRLPDRLSYVITLRASGGASSQEGAANVASGIAVCNSTANCIGYADLSNAEQCRAVVWHIDTAGTQAYAELQYNTAVVSGTWTDSGIVTPAFGSLAASTMRVGTWTVVPAGMKTDVRLRMFLRNGNGSENPGLGNMYLECR